MHGPARDTDLGTGRFVEPDHPLDMVRAIPVVGIQEGDGIVAEAECRQAAKDPRRVSDVGMGLRQSDVKSLPAVDDGFRKAVRHQKMIAG